MGTGYTRNDTSNNIADGNVINAADFDGEYDAIEAAFNSSSGHTHDGTASEGAPVTVLGPNQEFVASSSSVNPSTNAALDLGTASLKFKDLYIDGTAYIDGFAADILTATDKKVQFRDAAIFINSSTDGQLDIDADTTIELNSPEVIATDDFRLKSDAAILTFGADNDVTVTHVADTGLDAQAASGFVLKLQTGDTTVESGNTLGKISFNAPSEASGSDAILVGAEIEAAAEDTFSSTVNSTALVFKTNTGAAATERVRIKSDGDVVFTGASANMTWDTSADSLDFQDGGQIALGSDDDLVITHSGSVGSITNATGDLTIDAAADIILDVDGGDILLKDDGSDFGRFSNSSQDFIIRNSVSDKDIIFRGNDNSVAVDALLLDMSAAGKAIFNAGADFSAATTITTGDNTAQLTLISTDADANDGPLLVLNRNSSSPADGDKLGQIQFLGEDDADNSTIFGSIVNQIKDASNGSEDGRMSFNLISAGSDRTFFNMTHDSTQAEVVVNEDSIDMDFRVESNDRTHMLFVDAANNRIGINNDAPDTTFQITETTAPAILRLHRTGATNAADAVLGQLEFFNQDGSNDGPNVSAKITGSTHTSNGAGGNLRFFTHDASEGGEGSDPVERVRITGTGLVGIGTTSPGEELHIATTGGATAGIQIGTAGGTVDRDYKILVSSSAGSLFIQDATASVNRIALDSSGNVGIGTTAPSTLLQLEGQNTQTVTNNALRFKDIDTAVGVGQSVGVIEFETADPSNQAGVNAKINVIYAGTGGGSEMVFQTGLAGSLEDRLYIEDSATVFNEGSLDRDFRVESDANTHALFVDAGSSRVGILTASPSEALHVTGRSRINSLYLGEVSGSTDIVQGTSGNLYLTSTGSNITLGSSEAVFNEAGANLDFRVESDGDTHMLFVDADENAIGIGDTAPRDGSWGNSTDTRQLSIEANAFSVLHLKATDTITRWAIGAGGGKLYSAYDDLNGLHHLTHTASESVVNDGGGNLDFRIESDSEANQFYIDGQHGFVSIGKSTSAAGTNGLHIGSNGESAVISSTGSNNTWHSYSTSTNSYNFIVGANGTISYVSLNSLSDEREKTNIVDLPLGLETIKELRPRQFDWISDDQDNNVYGFIAQEVEQVLPSVVGNYMKDEDTERKSIKHIQLISILTKAMQEQQTIIERLEARITALENT